MSSSSSIVSCSSWLVGKIREIIRKISETTIVSGAKSLRCSPVLVAQPSNLKENVGLYQDCLPALKVVVDFYQQFLFWLTSK